MSEPTALTIHIDGGARGNPGPAAFAYVIAPDGASPIEAKGRLGETTNNVAEYTALVRALDRATELGGRRLMIYSDSELLVKQMNGEYKVKNPDLKVLFDQAKHQIAAFDVVTIRHVPRGRNSHADRLCNEALDGHKTPTAAKTTRSSSAPKSARVDMVREEAILCLRAAADGWARGQAHDLAPEDVWDQLWSILEEHGIV